MLIGTVDDQVLRFPLFKDRLTIGRTKDNDIQIKAAYVSRRHAVIQTDGDTTRIIDWGSKNGIHINSTRVKEHCLNHGDTVTIGNARFRYEELKKRDT
jgi:pSer/pThr/pTyr-binding forkhead associated (FHA) protein